jgi:hypothetical protein
MISTKDIQSKGGNLPKTLSPGEHVVKINSINLESVSYKEGAYHLILNVEGPDLGAEFEGFFINKDRPEIGRYKGQIGRVKFSYYPFSDGVTKTGIKVSRDTGILRAIQQVCISTDNLKWFEEADGKYNTIEEFIKGANKALSSDAKLRMCIGGKEYEKDGYTKYDLFLPKSTKDAYVMENASTEPSKLMKYNPTEHIKKTEAKPVSSFGSSSTDVNPFIDGPAPQSTEFEF